MNDRAYRSSLRIAAPPEDVFPYFTDPALLVRWMGDWAELEPTSGGAFAVDINGIPIRGAYVLVDPPHRLVFTWGAAGNETLSPGSTTVDITLTPDGEETLLELVHRDLPPEELLKHDIGWGHFLERLAVTAAGGDAGPDPWASE